MSATRESSRAWLVYNTDLANFRLTLCDSVLDTAEAKLALDPSVYALFNINEGDTVRCLI
jgi:arginine/ornithine N-succinyltransferase beta subunit